MNTKTNKTVEVCGGVYLNTENTSEETLSLFRGRIRGEGMMISVGGALQSIHTLCIDDESDAVNQMNQAAFFRFFYPEEILASIDSEVIDRNKIYKLHEGWFKYPDGETMCKCMEMVCPSTGKTYIVFVPAYNNLNDALKFINRCYGASNEEKIGYRQGDLLIAKIEGIADAALKNRWSNRMYNLNLIKET